MINWDRLEELKRDVGADDFGEVVQIFLEEVDDVVGRLGAGDADLTAEDMHFLKGSALNLGFAGFAEICAKAELAARDGKQVVTSTELAGAYARSRASFLENARLG